ncbi:MAG: hypothetical protein EPN91_13085 [Salinibacterium sp.]|nr:MAG: hypothetical protein EPN91_13085 [Salinibacterium sp.]
MSGDHCGATFRRIGSDFLTCEKLQHEAGLHVAEDLRRRNGRHATFLWWTGTSTQRAATEAEVAAELAEGARGTYVEDVPQGAAPSSTVQQPVAQSATDRPPAGQIVAPTRSDDPRVRAQLRQVSIESGFTGDACGECGAMKLTRNGMCMKCHGCGATTGCS